MKILKNTLKVEVGVWDDPGDYPSGAGGGPLPSYRYPEDISGTVIVELEPDDLKYLAENEIDIADTQALLDVINEPKDRFFEELFSEAPGGIKIKKWTLGRRLPQAEKLELAVDTFDEDGSFNDEPDYPDPDYDYEEDR